MIRLTIESPDDDTLENLTAAITALTERIEQMAAVTQAQLDALSTAITSAVDGIRTDIQAIKDAHPDVDTTSLDASVQSLADLDAENPPAAPPA